MAALAARFYLRGFIGLSLSRGVSSGHSPDYYTVLGVSRTATKDQIKIAYFKKAKRYHPDADSSEEANWMFQLVAEAYEVLSDDRKRKNFDQFGSAGERWGGRSARGPGRARGPENYDPEELFEKIFGEARNLKEDALGWDYDEVAVTLDGGIDSTKEHKIELSFKDAALGTEFKLPIHVKQICPKCDGSKSAMGYTWNVCPYCEGTGIETEKVGHVVTRHPCGHCEGTAKFIKYKCDKCEGYGAVIGTALQTVKIPPGCEDGQVFKLELDESILRWCTPDQERHFYAYVNIIPDDEFTREDLNVFSKAEISLSQLLLGGSVQVRGLRRDRLDVHVPPLHDLSRSLVARNEGVARSDGTDIGHHFIRLGLRLPRVLSQRQRSLMLAFAAATPLDQASEGAVKGLETDDSHRYEVGVVEPCAVARKFSTGQKKQRKDQEAEADVDEGSLWSRLRSSIFP